MDYKSFTLDGSYRVPSLVAKLAGQVLLAKYNIIGGAFGQGQTTEVKPQKSAGNGYIDLLYIGNGKECPFSKNA
jgi:hypothetical protein